MKGIVIATHGALAAGVMDALKMFSGEPEQVEVVGLMPEQDMADFTGKLSTAIDEVDSGEGTVVFCDLLFGTPCNCVARVLKDPARSERVEVVTGVNLPMILEYSTGRTAGMELDDVLEVGRDGIVDLKRQMGLRE